MNDINTVIFILNIILFILSSLIIYLVTLVTRIYYKNKLKRTKEYYKAIIAMNKAVADNAIKAARREARKIIK